jgi:CheY-like chemotaxis protein
VLIVEDNEDSAYLLADVLEERGHHAKTAFDGASALQLAKEHALDVMVLDIGLPDMDGYELIGHMRALSNQPAEVRYVALTGFSGPEHRARAIEAGFHTQLVKPVMPDAFVRLIEEPGQV